MGDSSAIDNTVDWNNSELLQAFDEVEDFNTSHLRSDLNYSGFDPSCGQTWVYPTNYPKREYQYSICKQALFQNTLVVLPTGLGKTFIASVVMYNIYRWYPKSMIIFMAPARPLVAQQINACYDIMGIPKEDTVELTGRTSRKKRVDLWATKRVIFATPQTVMSDLLSPDLEFPIHKVKLLVIDEAHKARGKYAYTQVVQMISERNKLFRVLALSATPGRNLTDVREIVQNLLISNIAVRHENSLDVAPYTFKKQIRTEVVQLDARIRSTRDRLIQIMEPLVELLKENNLVSGSVQSLSKGLIIVQKQRYESLVALNRPPNYSDISQTFAILMSLFFSLEALERHGVRMFINSFVDSESASGFKYFVSMNHELRTLIEELRQELDCNNVNLEQTMNESMVPKMDFYFGHPKYEVLERRLLTHFTDKEGAKAIIFSEFRETVYLIEVMLRRQKPLIRAKMILGQGSGGGGKKSVTQKEQLAVMKDFKAGKCNCLIATSVAEEGIDVGDVDLIVCFDSTTNPTRYVQRIGRTGRKQLGNVLMLLTEGKERDSWKKVISTKDSTNHKLNDSRELKWAMYKESPRLVPPEFKPACKEVWLGPIAPSAPTTANEEAGPSNEPKPSKPVVRIKKPRAKKEAPPKSPVTPVASKRDLRNFFKPVQSLGPILPVTQATPERVVSMDCGITRNDTWAVLKRLHGEILSRSSGKDPKTPGTPYSDPFFRDLQERRRLWEEMKENVTPRDLEKWTGCEEVIALLKTEMTRSQKSPEPELMEVESQPIEVVVPMDPPETVKKLPPLTDTSTPISKQAPKSKLTEEEVLKSLGLQSLDDLFGDDSPDFVEATQVQEPKKPLVVSSKIKDLIPDDFFSDSDDEANFIQQPAVPQSSPKVPPKASPLKPNVDRLKELVDFENIFDDSGDDLFADFVIEDTEEKKPEVPENSKKSMFSPTQRSNAVSFAHSPLSSLKFTAKQAKPSVFSPSQQSAASKWPISPISSLKFTARQTGSLPKTPPRQANAAPKESPETSLQDLEKKSPSVMTFNYSRISQMTLPPRISPAIAPSKVGSPSPFTPMQRANNKRKRRILSDDEGRRDSPETPKSRPPRKKRPKRSKALSFIDCEAEASDDEDDSENDSTNSLDGFVVANETIVDESPMRAKYLESLRSPKVPNGGFRIPQLKEYDPAEIYSQMPDPVESQFEVDGSFVVEDIIHDTEMSALELAEMALEAERKARKRRRRLY